MTTQMVSISAVRRLIKIRTGESMLSGLGWKWCAITTGRPNGQIRPHEGDMEAFDPPFTYGAVEVLTMQRHQPQIH